MKNNVDGFELVTCDKPATNTQPLCATVTRRQSAVNRSIFKTSLNYIFCPMT